MKPIPISTIVGVLGAVGWLVCSANVLRAQEVQAVEAAAAQPPSGAAPVVVGPDGKPMAPGQPGGRPGRPGPPGGPPGGPPNAAGQPGAEAGKKPGEAAAEGNKPVARPDKPSLPPDPRELKVKPDPNGKIRFNFHGQPWADVLEWLAAVSAMSLDWQELPGDYLNLVTQRDYTVPESRDLINRHLLARGYTLLEHGEVLSVVKIDKLNPGLVPRVEPEDLANHLPHEYLKVSFPLDWIISDKAVEELKPMLSPNAKITPLKNTNRVEAMDAAINLREVYALLKREQSDEPQQRLVKEFPLKHTRVTEVIDQLKSLLGIESKSASAGPMSPQQMEAMQQQQMMMQQMQRQGGQPPPQPKKDDDVHLVANMRRNCILAHAPPDKMEIIAQAVKAIDVESDSSQSLLTNINRMQVHRLHSIDPATLVKTLLEIGQLDPATRLEVDTKSNAIIAYASLADHLTIRQVVERLDGSGRKFEVLQLRRLEADFVAGTIEFMMIGPPEQKQQQSRYFDYFSPYGRSNTETKEEGKFRVDADVENNRLLLWANEIELEEVRNLLTKLGEIPARGGNPEKLRVLEVIPPDQLQQVLERLRQSWPSLAPNPLTLPPIPSTSPSAGPTPKYDSFEPAKAAQNEIKLNLLLAKLTTTEELPPAPAKSAAALPDAATRPATPDSDESDSAEPDKVPPAKVSAEKNPAERNPAGKTPAEKLPAEKAPAEKVPLEKVPAEKPAIQRTQPTNPESQRKAILDALRGNERSDEPSPITISVAPDGRLVLFSQDTQALDILEELIGQVAPPRRDYRIYKLKHADSFWVRKNLEDFFEESDDKQPKNSRNVYYYDYYNTPAEKDKPRSRLSKRKKLKLIDDLDTNSILVQGADAEQLRTIEDLIRIYDQPQEADSSAARLSEVIQIRYSKAQTIAIAVKDVYRDLLSSNDKALASNNPEQKNRIPSGANTYIINEDGGAGGGEKERTRVTFKGKLSIGVDEVTNTLLVSTEGENLMRNVTEMVKSLDEAAKPLSSVSVMTVGSASNASRVKEVLTRLLVEQKPTTPKPNGQPGPQGQVPQQPGVPNGVQEGAVQAVESVPQ